jgi:hypothetical protein
LSKGDHSGDFFNGIHQIAAIEFVAGLGCFAPFPDCRSVTKGRQPHRLSLRHANKLETIRALPDEVDELALCPRMS